MYVNMNIYKYIYGKMYEMENLKNSFFLLSQTNLRNFGDLIICLFIKLLPLCKIFNFLVKFLNIHSNS